MSLKKSWDWLKDDLVFWPLTWCLTILFLILDNFYLLGHKIPNRISQTIQQLWICGGIFSQDDLWEVCCAKQGGRGQGEEQALWPWDWHGLELDWACAVDVDTCHVCHVSQVYDGKQERRPDTSQVLSGIQIKDVLFIVPNAIEK